MNNIKTAEDVRNWAKMIVDAKGDKYTPLTKYDIFAIAQFIVNVGKDTAEDDKPVIPAEATPPPPENPSTTDCQADPPKPAADDTAVPKPHKDVFIEPTTTATMTRSYALHRAGFAVQQAYDRFLEWGKEHPKEASVMDFSTGKKSVEAAFAYWLAEVISVEVPNQAR